MNRFLPLNRRGGVLLWVSVLLLVWGLLAGDVGLVLLGGAGGGLLLVAFGMCAVNLRAMEVRAHWPSLIRAGKVFDLELSLYNHRKWWDSFAVEMVVFLPGNVEISLVATRVGAGTVSSLARSVVLPSRAKLNSHKILLRSSFPLGLFKVEQECFLNQEMTVTPRSIRPLELQSDGSLHDTQPRGGVTVGASLGEPRGVRPWQAGDAARRIHWPASIRSMARGHDLRVREYDPPGFHPDRCHLVFHSYSSGGEMLLADQFERAISLLTGSLTTLSSNGIPCRLTADFHAWQEMECASRFQLGRCLSLLAGVTRSTSTEMHDLENVFSTVSPDELLIVVSDMPPESWSFLLASHPRAMVVDIRQIRYQVRALYGGKT